MKVKAGDIFCTKNPMWLGRIIQVVEKLRAKDNRAVYTHTGTILDSAGTTLEELWTFKENQLSKYEGERILIGRWEDLNPELFQNCLIEAKKDLGQLYPFWRLPLFAIPGILKLVSTGKFSVCSERAQKINMCAGLDIGCWQDWNPDDVADMIRDHKGFSIIYEGVWPSREEAKRKGLIE